MLEKKDNFIDSFFSNKYEESKILFIEHIKNLDDEIFSKKEYKKDGWFVKEKRSIKIVDEWGELIYTRRIYRRRNKETNLWENRAFVDEKIGVLKYQTLTLNLELKILELSEGKRQKDILHCFPNINLTRMTISNVIRKYDIEYFSSHLFNEFKKIKLEENSCLYIFMDEGFVSLKEDKQVKDFRCRITTFNTGFNFKECKYNRKVLANKRGFVILKEQKTGEINTEDYVQRILMELERYYILPEKFKIIVGGDGDGWIIQTASFLGAKYVLDRFHFSKELKRAFLKGRKTEAKTNIYNECYDFFINGKYDKLLKIANSYHKTELVRYIKNHSKGIKNQKLEYNIGVSSEGDISWFLKSTLGYGAKAYAYKTYKNLLYLKLAKINKIDVITNIKNFYTFK